jgi:tetratricopeptide (TPR) repeat protein
VSHALVLGAGASLAAPACRPLFDGIRKALGDRLEVDLGADWMRRMAPEALLSRLVSAGIDIDAELRALLSGGEPNALHAVAAEVLRRGDSVWTTNFDELIETAAAGADAKIHRLTPGDDPHCECERGHLVKVHGTLTAERVLARSEDVLTPLADPWLVRLRRDLAGARVAIVGYAGADIDLRSGLADALSDARTATWFGRQADDGPLRRRFARPLGDGRLKLVLVERPDVAALTWARDEGLDRNVPARLAARLAEPIVRAELAATFTADRLLRARVLDDFGRTHDARTGYRSALLLGPRRREAGAALFSSGLIHGAPWRPAVVAGLNAASAMPVGWAWPHRRRLPYLTWNVDAEPRLRALESSLRVVGEDPPIELAAANAAKEVDPMRAIELAERAQRRALEAGSPAELAWATFTLSLALRWHGDVARAGVQAAQLVDAYGPLASPGWTAWGHFESGAVAALAGKLGEATEQMLLATELFTAAGSEFAFDAWCGTIAVHRAIGDQDFRTIAHREARRLLRTGRLRRRFKREVLLVEDGELARQEGRFDDAAAIYEELAGSATLAQRVLGLLGAGEVQRHRGREPVGASEALRVSDERSCGFGQVHACVTLGLAGAMDVAEAERRIAASVYDPPVRADADGLLRFCQGPNPDDHVLCFP